MDDSAERESRIGSYSLIGGAGGPWDRVVCGEEAMELLVRQERVRTTWGGVFLGCFDAGR